MTNRVVPRQLQEKAESELNEISGRIAADIKHIKKWIRQEPHLKHVKADDQFILNFLRGCKFSLQRTKEKLDLFYTTKSLVPELYGNRDPFLPEIQECLRAGPFLPLPKTDGEAGPRIILIRCKPDDATLIPHAVVLKTCSMIIDILLNEDDNFVIAGQQGFVDLKGMSTKHLLNLDINLSKICVICLQRAYATRPKRFCFINIPSFFEMVFNIFKPFLTEKIRKRISVHSTYNFSDVSNDIPLSLLPKEYGGDAGSLDVLTAFWKKKVESYRDWFLEDAKNCSDESKRRGSSKTSADVFGIQGSFRKLEVD